MNGNPGTHVPLEPRQVGQEQQHSESRAPDSLSTPVKQRQASIPPPASSPHLQHAIGSSTPRQQPPPTLRRTSSTMSLGSRAASSAGTSKLTRTGSKQSPGPPPAADVQEKRPTPKRSISNLIANLREAHAGGEPVEEPVPQTAAQIAAEHFARELAAHANDGVEAETVVILHDDCYGHRFSRLKSTKSALSMIVERPERVLASVLGASAAYVRLGDHYAGARHAPHPKRQQAVPPPFKVARTRRSVEITSTYVTNVHGKTWMAELQQMCDSAGDKLATGAKELSRTRVPSEPEKRTLHEGDLYLCSESLNAFQGALGGVADAVDTVFQPTSLTRRAFVAIRPPGHHCSSDYPSGFCWINNVHVGIEYAAQTHGLTHAVILDFDLHHGDGSQAITWERNSRNNQKRLNPKPHSKVKLNPDIGYFSLHDINSYPCEMGDDEKVQAASLCLENAHGQNIWNVHLQPWKTEDEFWKLYESRYRVLVDKARVFLKHHATRLRTTAGGKVQPRAAVFISAGFDASEWEGSGMQRHKVNVPTEFYARFTRDAVQLAQETDLACDGRVISVLEGGYSDRAICSGVFSHLSGLCAQPIDTGNDDELDGLMNGLRINGTPSLRYDKTWWAAANLTALEMEVNPPPPPAPGKKGRTGPQRTYATPTESFAYKVVDPNKFARSISGTLRESSVPPRPPTPPPPEVDWIVATHELSKLLIPTDRQTRSYTAEELGGVKVKRERQSVLPVMAPEETGKPRQLRDRKQKSLVTYTQRNHNDALENLHTAAQSSHRRQTLHEFPPTSEQSPDPIPPESKAGRRLSAGSALSSMDSVLEEHAPSIPSLPIKSELATTRAGTMEPPLAALPETNEMQVKKTRAPPKPRKGTPATSAPVSPATSATPSASIPSPRGASQTRPTSSNESGVDSLTSGMKKITLKLGTREEHDRKQREREAAERRARALKGAETRRVNAAAKKAAAAAAATKGGAPQHPTSVQKPTAAHERVDPAQQAQSPVRQPIGPAKMRQSVADTQIKEDSLPVAVRDYATEHSHPASDLTAAASSNHVDIKSTIATHDSPRLLAPLVGDVARDTERIQSFPTAQLAATSGPLSASLTGAHNSHATQPATVEKASALKSPDGGPQTVIRENEMPTRTLPMHPPSFNFSPSALRSPNSEKLPVWSSTGPIPFAPAPAPPTPVGDAKPSKSIPESMQKQGGDERQSENVTAENPDLMTIVGGNQREEQEGGVLTHARREVGERSETPDENIWDVPTTPQV